MSTGNSSLNPLIIDGISYLPSSVLLNETPKLSIKDNQAFAVLDPRGEAPRAYAEGSALGIYCNDTRHLSTWELTLNGTAPIPLANELRYGGNTLVLSMTNRDMPELGAGHARIPRDTLLVQRTITLVQDTLYDMLLLQNFGNLPLTLQLEQWVGSRFEDIFEIRGYPRARRGRMLATTDRSDKSEDVTVFAYEGLDGKVRKTFFHQHHAAEKIRPSPSLTGFRSGVTLPPKGEILIRSQAGFDAPAAGELRGRPFAQMSHAEFTATLQEYHQKTFFAGPTGVQIETDNAIVNRAIQNAATDINMLLTRESAGVLYPYAGVPWFSAPFGRDGIITAYQMLPWFPELAKGVLEYVFRHLGTRYDDFTDEQPGKVFHEFRRGEMARTREVPFVPYFGSVDATPLALILLHEYVTWTRDLDQLKIWWPQALAALEWVERHGDANGDGFLEYAKLSPTGLVNQGWKDSHDSIMHSDGRLAVAPISLCEVQAYAFRARMGMSELARWLGQRDRAENLRMGALQLKARFIERYWEPARGMIHLALDGDASPCAVLSSNMGHCLWGGILDAPHADSITRHLMSDALFSGYGIRTLATTEVAYNPLSYHNGSIWPHDNSLIMEGLRNYGKTAELERLALAAVGVLETSTDFRLPELYCGFPKQGEEPPVPYEVACKPQAWAAGSIFLMLRSMLGLSMDADHRHLTFQAPLLTSKIGALEIRGLRGREWEMDLALRRSRGGTQVEVRRRQGSVRVLTVK